MAFKNTKKGSTVEERSRADAPPRSAIAEIWACVDVDAVWYHTLQRKHLSRSCARGESSVGVSRTARGGGTVARGCPPEVGDRGNLGARGRRGPRADSPGFNSSVERARTQVDGETCRRARITDGRKIVRRHARFMLCPAPRPHRGPGDVRTSLRRAVWLEISGDQLTSQHRGGAVLGFFSVLRRVTRHATVL